MDVFFVAHVLLACITALVVVCVLGVWRSTGYAQFAVGLALVYYYSIFGAWHIVAQKAAGISDDSLTYLESSLFPVAIDAAYLLSLVIYGVFVLALGLSVLLLAGVAPYAHRGVARHPEVPGLSHPFLLAVSACALGLSAYLVWDGIATALDEGVSAYTITRGDVIPFYSLHLLLNRIGIAAIAIGSPVCLLTRERGLARSVGYVGVGVLWVVFLGLIGNRNELMMGGVSALCWYWILGGRLGARRASIGGVAAFMVLRSIESTRGMGIDEMGGSLGSILSTTDFWNPFDLANGSESVAAHLSLYGIISQDVPLTFGSSLLYFVNSIVPQAILGDRVPDSYSIYANAVSAEAGQGFNIHYAAGWYLNFGVPGVVAGGVIAGLLWYGTVVFAARCIPGLARERLCWLCAFCFVSAFAPMLMRNGPEGLKGLLVEAIAIPFGLAWLSFREKSSHKSEHESAP